MKHINISDSRPCGNRNVYSAVVDDDVYEWLSSFQWTAYVKNYRGRRNVYAGRKEWRGGKLKLVLMHRAIWESKNGRLPKSTTIDHVEHGQHAGLDNRLLNLRLASFKDQQGNRRKSPGTSSQFKGVCWDRSRLKWLAKIYIRDRIKHIGRFPSENDAALAYDTAAREHFGIFARTNFERVE